MKENANRIVIGVVVVLVVVVVFLLVGSGACTNAGGGGGGGAPTTPAASSPSAASASASSASAGSQSASASSPTAGEAGDENYGELRDQLTQELSEGTAPVGANAHDASGSANVTTVAQAHDDLQQRGFGDLALSATFDISGNYIGSTVLDSASGEKLPSYQATYQSGDSVEWRIVVNDGRVFAVPTAAKAVTISKEIIFSETDSVLQYDGVRNQYSEFSFADLAAKGAIGVKVDKVDKATLDSYTPEMLAGM